MKISLTPAAKVVYAVALVIGIAVGAYFGFDFGATEARIEWETVPTVAQLQLRQFALAEYRYADPMHGEEALQTYVDILQKLEKLNPRRFPESHIAESFARLAMLEQKSGNAIRAGEYFDAARHWYKLSGSPVRTNAELAWAIQTSDAIKDKLGFKY